jgi:hypothetical protein
LKDTNYLDHLELLPSTIISFHDVTATIQWLFTKKKLEITKKQKLIIFYINHIYLQVGKSEEIKKKINATIFPLEYSFLYSKPKKYIFSFTIAYTKSTNPRRDNELPIRFPATH